MGKRVIAVILLLAVAGIASVMYVQKKKQILNQAETTVSHVTQQQQHAIINYFDTQEEQVVAFAGRSEVIQALENRTQAKSKAELKNDEIAFFEKYRTALGYKNILLISNQLEIVFSLTTADRGINLSIDPYRDTALAESVMRVKMGMTADIADFAYYAPLKRPALFLSAPILKEAKLIGIFVAQLDEQVLRKIVNNYRDLGSTGETVLAKQVGDTAVFVTPTRYNAEAALVKSVSFYDPESLALERAVLGQRGIGIVEDYRGVATISSWRYLPMLSWGMSVKIDEKEVLGQSKHWWVLIGVLLAVVSILLIGILLFQLWQWIAAIRWNRATQNRLLLMLMGVMLVGISVITYQSFAIRIHSRQRIQFEAEQKLHTTLNLINLQAHNIEFIAQAIVADLESGRLAESDLSIRLDRDMREHGQLHGITIAYDPTVSGKAYAPAVIREKDVLKRIALEEIENYTQPAQPGTPNTDWYMNALKGPYWSEPFTDPVTKKLIIAYSVPFFDKDKKPIGVVSVFYSLGHIKEIVRSLGLGATGYGFLITDKGHFLYHPIESFVAKQETIFSVADASNNQALRTVGEQAAHEKQGVASYISELTGQKSTIYFEKAPSTNWSLMLTFAQIDAPINYEQLHHYYLLLIAAVVLFFIFFLLYVASFFPAVRAHWISSFGVAGIFFVGILVICLFVRQESLVEKIQGTPILDSVSLNKFLHEAQQIAANHYESPPQALKAGIEIESFSFPSSNDVEFSGNVWILYRSDQNEDLKPKILFPQAMSMDMRLISRVAKEGQEISTWWVHGTLAQKFENSRYPFDIKNIDIAMEFGDQHTNIILIPDLKAYSSMNPDAKSGISRRFNIAGFNVDKTLFTIQKAKKANSLNEALYEITNISERYSLHFNVVMQRTILDALTIYILPLFIILLALYTMALFSRRRFGTTSPYTPLSGYTAVMFALVLLHRTLREKLPGGQILYIEYFFFFTYLTLLLLIFSTVIVYTRTKLHSYARTFINQLPYWYWPIELGLSFFVTVFLFY